MKVPNSDNTGKEENSSVEKLTQEVSQLKDSLKSISKSLVDVTDNALKSQYCSTRDQALLWLGLDSKGTWPELNVEKYHADGVLPPYEHHDFLNALLDAFDDLMGISNVFGSKASGRTPFGYFARNTPTIRQYNDCMEKQGLSIWESTGYWRCLFPNDQIPVDMMRFKANNLSSKILTKQDFESEAVALNVDTNTDGPIDLGIKGLFFRHFEDLLKWKNLRYKTSNVEKPFAHTGSGVTGDDKGSQVLSTRSETSFTYNPELNRSEMVEVTKQTFSNGDSITETVKKYKPFDSDDWVQVSNTRDNVKSPGWFWKNE